MAETQKQYTKRILGYLGSQNALTILAATPGKLARAIAGVSLARLSKPPAKGKWSVRQILAHLAEDEMVWGYRIRKILEKNGVAIEGFDQARWAVTGRYGKIDPRLSLEMHRALRKANLALFAGLSRSEWKRYGRHSEFGRVTIEKIARQLAGHDLNHMLQMKRILA